MKTVKLNVIQDVLDRQLCAGCGACAAVEPDRFRMDDQPAHGRRPVLVDSPAAESGRGIAACPGISLEHTFDRDDPGLIRSLTPAWGPVREVWEGYASDTDLRRGGSSGGAASALALYGIERGGMGGVVHTAAREDAVHLNRTVYSTTREEILERTGSRYAPASPCDGLGRIAESDKPSVFIGKPCDAAGAHKARSITPALDQKLGITIAFFCAGTPSSGATVELLKKMGCDDPGSLTSLRYRGNGWPGMWRAEWTGPDGDPRSAELTYADSWGFLQSRRQWRCYVCPDHTGEFADIAVGDPWYRPVEPGEAGKSLILARTERGLAYLRAAAEAGYITLETKDAELLPRSQPNLLRTRGRLWGQMLALRPMGLAPRFRGFPLFPYWIRNLNTKQKIESVVGTIRRVKRRGIGSGPSS